MFTIMAIAGPAAAQQPARPPLPPPRKIVARPPLINPQILFGYEDYPAEAILRNEEGTVRAELTVGSDGRVKACKVMQSSNSASLDSATCNVFIARAKFTPASDANGNAVEGTYLTPPINWRMPNEPPPPPETVPPAVPEAR